MPPFMRPSSASPPGYVPEPAERRSRLMVCGLLMIAAVTRFGWATLAGAGPVGVWGAAGAQPTNNAQRAMTSPHLMDIAMPSLLIAGSSAPQVRKELCFPALVREDKE